MTASYSIPGISLTRIFAACGIALSLSILGCDSQPSQVANVANDELAPIDQESVVKRGSVSIADAEEFAAKWEQAFIDNNLSAVERLLDTRALMAKALTGLEVTDKQRQGVMQGGGAMTSNLLQSVRQISQDGNYTLLRVITRDGTPHVIMRVLSVESGLNYHDLMLEKIDGKVVATDIFVALTGESLSQTMRGLLAPTLASDQSIAAKITGEHKANLRNLEVQQKMVQAIQAQQFETAIEHYNSLSGDAKQWKLPLIYRLQAISMAPGVFEGTGDQDAYMEAIGQFEKLYPNDPCLGLLLLDKAILSEDRELLMKSVEAINGWTGGDDYIQLAAGTFFANWGDKETALEISKAADPAKVGVSLAHDFKMTIALAANDFDEVANQLKVLRDDYGIELGDLSQVEGFEEFAASEAYQQFLKASE